MFITEMVMPWPPAGPDHLVNTRYSADLAAGVHVVSLTSYAPHDEVTVGLAGLQAQLTWLEADLQAVSEGRGGGGGGG